MPSDTVNLVAFTNFDNICYSKKEKIKKPKRMNETMAEKARTIEVHVLTFFQNFC